MAPGWRPPRRGGKSHQTCDKQTRPIEGCGSPVLRQVWSLARGCSEGSQLGRMRPCPQNVQAKEDHCVLPALPASLPARCLPQHPTLQGSEVGARALWYLQAPQDQHHSLSPGRDGDALLSAWGLWGCLHRGVRHKRRKAWQGAEVGTVSRSRWSRKKMHAVAHRCPHGLDGDFKGSCHPQGDPSQAGEAGCCLPPHPKFQGIPRSGWDRPARGCLCSHTKLLTEDEGPAGSNGGSRRGRRGRATQPDTRSPPGLPGTPLPPPLSFPKRTSRAMASPASSSVSSPSAA